MGKLISLLIDRSQQRLLGAVLWLASFVVVLAIGLFLVLVQLGGGLRAETERSINAMQESRSKIEATAALLPYALTAAPCSPAFHEQLRRIAYRPDGINEFLYAPNGVVLCSVSQDIAPFDLGEADVVTPESHIYLDKHLDFLGLRGSTGTISRSGDFAIVIPRFNETAASGSWFEQQMVMRLPVGVVPRAGVIGIAERAVGAVPVLGNLSWNNGNLYYELCDYDGLQCAITEGSLLRLLEERWPSAILALAIAALVALAISGQLHNWLRRHWSFESRFRRNFKPESIICTYQPILSVETGNISGCEVLVRWRDVDGSVIFPDQFLPIIARRGLSRDLTRMVVQRAFEELTSKVPPHLRLQVNINIEPSDLDAIWLRDTLSRFEDVAERFRVVVEIVESDELQIEHAAREIEALRRYGIPTQLDDFGTGYSNIQNLATLPLDGVKLDRSFAMAADEALMHRMMFSTIEMVHAAGHRLTVEGVESEARLRQLAATGHVQFVQGYHISRPVEIDRFVQLLGERTAASRPRLVA